jgi:hypothetical protein
VIRTLITPQKDEISIRLPNNYIGKQVEVIAFTVDESDQQSSINKQNIPFVVLHVEDKNFKFNREEANER